MMNLNQRMRTNIILLHPRSFLQEEYRTNLMMRSVDYDRNERLVRVPDRGVAGILFHELPPLLAERRDHLRA